ncbi:MAG TPA: steroid 3-ketoacyl-CoA thiolase [Candidatus Dormibacteraeota bacterium]|nr:steroid 3-ketoacyl-CoA thiolase [Candidatus Dormibacteraeota bacterium]
MNDTVILETVRTAVGRRGGALAGVHPADLLGLAQREVLRRAGVEPQAVGQVVGGCVTQVGEQSFNVTRTAWLAAGLPATVAATTVDTQCGSSQQAVGLAAALVGSGVVDLAVGCGVEVMSRLPIGSNFRKELGYGRPIPKTYFAHHAFTSQFEAAERIATTWGVSREEADQLALTSHRRAARAWAEGRFDAQVLAVEAPELDAEGSPSGAVRTVARDEGMRETNAEALAQLKAVMPPNGIHTAGSSSQISDGAAAVLFASAERAQSLGLRPRARVVDSCLVGVDPELMLTGPIDATSLLLQRTGLSIDDIDVVEINEAFASVVLAWARECHPDMERVNPNGGAIALGHPLGATGAILVTKALAELERTRGRYALITMCCGGGLGTGTIIERL